MKKGYACRDCKHVTDLISRRPNFCPECGRESTMYEVAVEEIPAEIRGDSEFRIYSEGLCKASVCTSLPREQVEARMNLVSPTGISSQWAISDKEEFKTGEPNPCPCDNKPETHKHYLMEC